MDFVQKAAALVYAPEVLARDMDLLRQAVGDKQLTYAGYSCGTYLGRP